MPFSGRLFTRRLAATIVVVAAALAAVPAQPVRAASGAVVLTYDVGGRGNAGDLEAFAATAAETYADPRGWSAGGLIRFARVASGQASDFTLWLAADAEMSTFGGACDVVWSCRNGRNVVINEDRWQGATPAWNATGWSLRDYRHMVVNHETGHWLDLGHQHCAAAGSPAPVMQQQSMGLQGCTPNPWPLTVELGRAQAGPRVRDAAPTVPVTTVTTRLPRPPVASAPEPPAHHEAAIGTDEGSGSLHWRRLAVACVR